MGEVRMIWAQVTWLERDGVDMPYGGGLPQVWIMQEGRDHSLMKFGLDPWVLPLLFTETERPKW